MVTQHETDAAALLQSGILAVITHGAHILQSSARWRNSCEGWLKAELLAHFNDLPGTTARPEQGNIDLTIVFPTQTVLLELKTFPTNYGGTGKPITNFIQGVVTDLQKLRRKVAPSEAGYVLWLAYPIPDPVPLQWLDKHHPRVIAASASTTLLTTVALERNLTVHVYLSRCPEGSGTAQTT
jgi:hypothetical protein